MSANELVQLTDQWRAIKDREQAAGFYKQQIFPLVRRVVVEREQGKLSEPYTHLILPVGLSPEPLILSIAIFNPQKVYFLYTHQSSDFLDEIVAGSALKLSQVDKDEIDETNVPDIYNKVKQVYEKWGSPKQLAIDISGGKKSMIGACALAGVLLGARIFYMDSTYLPDLRKPQPGSEHLVLFENPYNVFGDLKLERASDLFAGKDYEGAYRLLEELRAETSTPDLYAARADLCQAYAAWDDFRIHQAKDCLAQTIQSVERIRRLEPSTPLNGQLPRLRQQLKALERLQAALALNDDARQLDLLQTAAYYQPLIGTLRAGALRQEKRGKLDVAALLWYRLIELLSQRRLAGYGLLTSRANYAALWAMGQTDEAALLQRYREAAAEAEKKKDQTSLPAALPNPIALLEGYTLLKALKDPYAMPIHLGKIRSKINTRNHGIFAHGFSPLGQKDYEDFKGLALDLLEHFRQAESEHLDDWEACEFIEAI